MKNPASHVSRFTHDAIWSVGEFQPKKVLTDILRRHSQNLTPETALSHLTDEQTEILRKHPLIQELCDFLSADESS